MLCAVAHSGGLSVNRVGGDVNSVCTLSKIYKSTGVEVRKMNRVISQIRQPVETVFARLKQYRVLRGILDAGWKGLTRPLKQW